MPGSSDGALVPNSSVTPGVVTRPGLRTGVLTVALVVASVIVLFVVDLGKAPVTGVHLSWWAVALLAIAAELMVFNIVFRNEVYSFTFSEIPLVLGLFLAGPRDLIIGRLLGELLFLTLKERQPFRKVTLNLASFLGECVVMLSVFRLLGQDRNADLPVVWLATLTAVSAGVLLGFVVVAAAVRWHGGLLKLRSIVVIGALTAPVNTALTLVAVILLGTNPWACLLLAGVAAFLLLSYRSYTALDQRFDSLSLLYDFTRTVSGVQRPNVVLEAILAQAKDMLRSERAVIWLADETGGFTELAIDGEGHVTRALPGLKNDSVARWFRDSADAVIIARSTTDVELRALATALSTEDCIVAPITESGVIVGLIAVAHRLGEMNEFRAQEGAMFATLANHASVALENGRLITRLHEQAHQREHESLHDALTGLPNRVMFAGHLESSMSVLRDGEQLAVAVMDLNGFKEINDTLGHQAGDTVLVEVAERISRAMGSSRLVARLGGDEFAVLFPPTQSRAELEECGREIRTSLSAPLRLEGVRVNLGISIGFSVAPDDGNDAALLLQRADVAMYAAKTGIGDGVSFYDAASDTNTPRRLALSSDLGSAILNGEITMVYQPIVRMTDGRVMGVESLARWCHSVYGDVTPDEFIPLAERNGAILQLTEFALGEGLRQAAEWQRAGLEWGVSVNVSMRNLLEKDVVETVTRLISSTELDPAMVTLEITESNVMSDSSRAIDLLEQLANLGVRLAIDDFGTGYSSLSYLQRLPAHAIKIDKSFVVAMANDAGAEAIVRSVLDLARNMGMLVVAEGVEDRPTWNRLRDLGCDSAQGFFLAQPMPAYELTEWAARHGALSLSAEDPCVARVTIAV